MVKIRGIKGTLTQIQQEKQKLLERGLNVRSRQLVSRLKEATPVDTGRARDGWHYDNRQIQNAVEYVDHLNKGSSKQAPRYFVEKTLLSHADVSPSGVIVRSD